eukprot:Gb_14211 [translate_table: standard]
MRTPVISTISKWLSHYSNPILTAQICRESMRHLCPSYRNTPFCRDLRDPGLREIYYNGKVFGGIYLCEGRRLCKRVFFRAASSQAFVTETPTYEEITEEPLPVPRQYDLYRRLIWLGDSEGSAVAALEEWLMGCRKAKKWELKRIIKDLRHYNRYEHALEISKWMGSYKRFPFSPSDHAIHLDLMAKVHGIGIAEKYFAEIPDIAKNQLTYCALLNCYVNEKLTDKSESIMEKLKELGFATNALAYNEMMKLYMTNGQLDKVLLLIQEMNKNGVMLDICSYNIWMTTCAAISDMDKMQDVLYQIKHDDNVNSDWTVYNTLAKIYIEAGRLEDAESALRELESKMTHSDRVPYDRLISLYGRIGNKQELYRIWRCFQLAFPKMTIKSYVCLLSALVKIGDIEGAENIFEEWDSVASTYDVRVPNVLLGAYIRKGLLAKAEVLLEHILERGGKPNSNTWEILAEGYIEKKQIDQAVEAMKRALSIVKLPTWQPKSVNVLAILKIFENKGDVESAEEYFNLLRGVNYVSTEIYNSLLRTYIHVGKDALRIIEHMRKDNISPNEETSMLLKQAREL